MEFSFSSYQLMLECWSFLPGDRPTFRHCLDVLQQLQATTSGNIEITVATPNPRNSNGEEIFRFFSSCICFKRMNLIGCFVSFVLAGGIFNRSYLLADNNMHCPINPRDTLIDNMNNTNNNNSVHAINYNITKPGESSREGALRRSVD